VTRYELFRKRIAPALFLGVVGLIAYDTCRKQQRTHATVALDFGEVAADVRSVDAELTAGGESMGSFHKRALPGSTIGPCSFETLLVGEVGELRIDVTVRDRQRTLVRTIRPIEESTVTVSLGPDLR
jgi:hypothetical protein